MDTKSTKFKYSFFTKGLCLILSALLFFSFVFLGATIIEAVMIYGYEEYLSGDIPDFYKSYGFISQFSTDNYYARVLATNSKSAIDKAYENNQKTIIDDAVNKYLTEKAAIIHDELLYAVENYDESYFNYEYTADAVDIPEQEITAPGISSETTTLFSSQTSPEPLTDENGEAIPRNIEVAKKVLENCEGLELLDYAALVRESAFTENEFQYYAIININGDEQISFYLTNPSGYDMNEAEIRKNLLAQYNSMKESESGSAESNYVYALSRLSSLEVFKYYVKDSDGNINTNVPGSITEEEFKADALKKPVYILFDENETAMSDLPTDIKDYYNISYENLTGCKIYAYIDDSRLQNCDDSYANLFLAYNSLSSLTAKSNIILAVISLLLSFIFLIAYLCLCGRKNSYDTPVTAYIDKLPTDIHFVLSFGIIAGLTALGFWIVTELVSNTSLSNLFIIYGPACISAILTVSYLFFAEWLASTVRIKKAGKKFFERMLISKLIFAIGRMFRKLMLSVIKFFSVLKYKPKKMQRTVILIVCCYVFGNLLLTLIACLFYDFGVAFLAGVAAIVYNSACLFVTLRYFKNLDIIIDASCRHESVDFGNEKMPNSLQLLASNLTNTNEALQEAVARAVRDEQMKTELITNVSHDLKTPLTSLISYSDLLDKCDIKDETAQKYIGVIHTQSIKLKRLIEDLIEASKVSTGNVTINTSKLNLSELAIQVIAEFAPEMEKNGNEIRFSEPETPPSVFADGSKTYRILSNLLSNAKKYSAPDTRVYVSVYTDGISSYFEIKNISSEPLNIMPEELTERFVRGDKSRSKEGNGLGLSIAKDLCSLQNGSLHLAIDGDLFKAIVKLPAAGEIPVTDNTIEN